MAMLRMLSSNSIEDRLKRMKDLSEEIKVLQAEYDMLRKEVIGLYFSEEEEYRTDKGLVLATYKSYEEKRFNTKRFEEDHPDIYEWYKETKMVYKFLLK